MLYLIARMLGPRVRRLLIWFLIALVLWLLAGKLHMWGAALVQGAEEQIVQWGGGALLIEYKTRYAIGQLEAEIDRLRSLQFEAEAGANESATLLEALAVRHTTLQAEMLRLAEGLDGQPIFDSVTGRTLTESEVRLRAEEKVTEFSHVVEQLALYEEAYTLQQHAARRAKQMQYEAEQSIASLNAHLAVVSARALWQGAASEEILTAAQLQTELEYARKLAAEREALEGGLSPVELIPASSPPLPSVRRSPYPSLAAELRESAATPIE